MTGFPQVSGSLPSFTVNPGPNQPRIAEIRKPGSARMTVRCRPKRKTPVFRPIPGNTQFPQVFGQPRKRVFSTSKTGDR